MIVTGNTRLLLGREMLYQGSSVDAKKRGFFMNYIFLRRECICCILFFIFLLFFLTSPLSGLAQGNSFDSPKGKKVYLSKNYHALVIGVSKYDSWENIPNAAIDAKDIYNFFRGRGYEATLLTNPGSRELRRAMETQVNGVGQKKDQGIILYYSGHSATQNLENGKKMGWIIPSDCPRMGVDQDKFTDMAISTEEIKSYAARILSRHMIMIFDSSFSSSD